MIQEAVWRCGAERMERPDSPEASQQNSRAAARAAINSASDGPKQPEEARPAEAAAVTQSADHAEDPEAAGHAEPAGRGDSHSLIDNLQTYVITPR